MALSVMSEGLAADAFQHQVESCQLALDRLANAVDALGLHQFPDLFVAGDAKGDIDISKRPLQLLRTIAEKDMTLAQASEELFISRDTANKHIAAAKEALGVTTIAGAVLKAVEEGLVGG